MKRRDFLVRIGGAMVAVPSVLVMTSACGGDDGGGADAANATSFTIGSTGGTHTHMLTIQCADLSNANGVTYTSSTDQSHSHMVMISAADLATIAGGGSVTITTTDAAHTHDWTIARPTGACA